MKSVETFKNREAASEKQRLLKDRGIDARVIVDPMESFAPALSTFQDVVLMVRDDAVPEALRVLRESGSKKAS